MKTINIAPTWLWVGKMYFVSIQTKSPKATKGFRSELKRLGKNAVSVMKDIEYGKMSKMKRQELEEQLLNICRNADGCSKKYEG